jgi:hypothetical protein
MTIEKNCKECSKKFNCDSREHNRGNGNFCSISCGMKHTNKNRKLYELLCKHCGSKFLSSDKRTKYCSYSCKQKNYRRKARSNNSHDKALLDKLRLEPCAICGWNISTRDVHHIVDVAKGGKNEESNLITLCPNHHRMVHNNLISQDNLLKITKSRTISSS